MTIHLADDNIETASSCADLKDIAYSFMKKGDLKNSDLFLKKAYEAAKHFEDFLGISWDLYHQYSESSSAVTEELFQSSLKCAEDNLDTVLAAADAPDFDFLNRFDFVHNAQQFHTLHQERLALKALHIAYYVEQDNTFFDFMATAHAISSLVWVEERDAIEALMLELKQSVNTCLELDNETLFKYKGEDTYRFQHLTDAGVQAIEIPWADVAEECYKRIVSTSNEIAHEGFMDRLLNLILHFGEHSSFKDRCLKHFKWLIDQTEDVGDLAFLASCIGTFQDSDAEAEVFHYFKQKHGEFLDQNKNLLRAAEELQDSELKHHLLHKIVQRSNDAFELLHVIRTIHGKKPYEDLFAIALGRVALQSNYLHAIFEEYALQHNLPFEEFLKRLKEVVSQKGLSKKDGQLLLLKSCRLGRNEAIEILLEMGIDSVFEDEDGINPLIASLKDLNVKYQTGGEEVSRKFIFDFIESGIDIHKVYTMQRGAKTTALHEAACDGYLDVVKVLLEKGANMELDDDRGQELLLSAAYTSRSEVIRYLLSCGCDATTIYKTPGFWHYNREKDELETVRLLKEAGAPFQYPPDPYRFSERMKRMAQHDV